MIEKLLTEEVIDVNIKAENWEEAVTIAGKLLLKSEKIEERYIEAMIETVKEMGPYIVMAPGIAMPHGRPDSGVLELGISVISLEKGLNFGSSEFDPVKLVFAICAKENKTHIELLQDLSYILDDENLLKDIEGCNSKEDLLRVILDVYERNKTN
ncbi:MAG: PTS sugar transporter subunit IIA [Clostridium sp.]|uniref:PTS sugar transporter subunit IIA n=1 Tax=Clostridium sp. TaxID=1506 RepID=UPI0025BD7DD1|nr:PTS sugar transporter subunit IIA [Clostridium sp.]MCF0147972.1 PTS sugar transporter subunit IIA [Clostridium sp.]